MKKLLIIITLFVSSFFLFCRNEVKAYEYTKEVDFSIMEDVISLKEMLDSFIQTDTTYSDYYIIYQENTTISYLVFKLDGSTNNLSITASGTNFYIFPNQSLAKGTYKKSVSLTSSTSKPLYMYSQNTDFLNNAILYANFNIRYADTSHTFTYNYQDFSYTENTGKDNRISTLYDIYLIYQEYLGAEQENPHQEEIDKVTNFYTMVIEKIEYLANEISNNYILLFVIGIFIVTFVFLLIFRRFL